MASTGTATAKPTALSTGSCSAACPTPSPPGALRPGLDHHWDLRIWIDIDSERSLQRGIDRDAGREGRAEAEALHRRRCDPAEAIYTAEVAPRSRADIVIDNSDIHHPRFIDDS